MKKLLVISALIIASVSTQAMAVPNTGLQNKINQTKAMVQRQEALGKMSTATANRNLANITQLQAQLTHNSQGYHISAQAAKNLNSELKGFYK